MKIFVGENGKYHYVYKTTNKLNGRFYIGKHSFDSYENNYYGSGLALKAAIRKYSKENFTKEILMFFTNPEQAYQYEKELVNEILISNDLCYNIKTGGVGFGSGESNPGVKASKEGRHWQTGNNKTARKLLANGTHNFININEKRINSGTHNFQRLEPWNNYNSRETWSNADIIFELYSKNTNHGYIRLINTCNKFYPFITFTNKAIKTMVDKFRSGWIPINDKSWIDFQVKQKAHYVSQIQ